MSRQITMGFDAQNYSDLSWWGGYTFGWPKCLGSYAKWCSGVTITPRYVDRLDGTRPVMLDNGAYPAWRRGEPLTLENQIEGLLTSFGQLGCRIEWVVLPDSIGDAKESKRRREIAVSRIDFESIDARPLVPVQEGADLLTVAKFCHDVDGGFFIGGKTREWKMAVAAILSEREPERHLHVARISSSERLRTCSAIGVDSFDTTTFLRSYGANKSTDYGPRLKAYCERYRSQTT